MVPKWAEHIVLGRDIWYDAEQIIKLCLLGLFAIVQYISIYTPDWASFAVTEPLPNMILSSQLIFSLYFFCSSEFFLGGGDAVINGKVERVKFYHRCSFPMSVCNQILELALLIPRNPFMTWFNYLKSFLFTLYPIIVPGSWTLLLKPME